MSTGPDVLELETNLLSLGVGQRFGLLANGNFAYADEQALDVFAKQTGVTLAHGTLPVGSLLFEPGPIVVTGYATALGTPVSAGTQILQATSTTAEVIAQVDPAQAAGLAAGANAAITLASGATAINAVVSQVESSPPNNTAAATSSSGNASNTQQPGGGQSLYVTLALDTPPESALAQGSTVAVELKLAVIRNALVVPVTALVALVGGGYALQVDDGRGRSHLVGVTVGLVDAVDDLVEVSGPQLREGLLVEAPSAS